MDRMLERLEVKLLFFLTVSILTFIGCGSSGSDTPPPEVQSIVTGIAAKGPVFGGTVSAYPVVNGAVATVAIASGPTGNDGSYSLDLGDYTGTILLQVDGGQYLDEASGLPVDLTTPLRVILTGFNAGDDVSNIAITPLTEIATRLAELGGLTGDAMDKANQAVSQWLGPNGDIVTTLPADVTDGASQTASTEALNYGLLLAAISQMDADDSGDLSGIIQKLVADLSDGQLQATATKLSDALESFIADNSHNYSGATEPPETIETALTGTFDVGNLNPGDVDSDNDGYSDNQGDCDDNDPSVFPGYATWYHDADDDGYSNGETDTTSCSRPEGFKLEGELTRISGDCDDSEASIHPDSVDTPNDGIDQDCDGEDLTDIPGDGYQIDYGYLQYRTYETSEYNAVRGCFDISKNGSPVDASEITNIVLRSENGSEIPLTQDYYDDSDIEGTWNETTSSVDFFFYEYSSFMFRFPETPTLEVGIYTYEVTTIEADTLTLELNYPGNVTIPYVQGSSINHEWQIDNSLRVNWTNPEGTYDQIRFSLYDTYGNALLYVSLPSSAEEFILPSTWVDYFTARFNLTEVAIQIQTRISASSPDRNNYARGYSDSIDIPWQADEVSLNILDGPPLTREMVTGYWTSSFNTDHCLETVHISFSDDGTFQYDATEDCSDSDDYYYESSGTWRIQDGLLYTTETYISNPDDFYYLDMEQLVLSFVTSHGKLDLNSELEEGIYYRIGTGNEIYGSWIRHGEDCDVVLDISTDNELVYDEICPASSGEDFGGTFTLDDDHLTLDTGSDTLHFYYTFYETNVGTVLLFDPESFLFTQGEDPGHDSTPTSAAVIGSWTSTQLEFNGSTNIKNLTLLGDGTFSYTITIDYPNTEEDDEYTSSGTWRIYDGTLYMTLTSTNDPDENVYLNIESAKQCYILWDDRMILYSDKEDRDVLFERSE